MLCVVLDQPSPEQPPEALSAQPDERAPSPDIALASNQSNQHASNIDPGQSTLGARNCPADTEPELTTETSS